MLPVMTVSTLWPWQNDIATLAIIACMIRRRYAAATIPKPTVCKMYVTSVRITGDANFAISSPIFPSINLHVIERKIYFFL